MVFNFLKCAPSVILQSFGLGTVGTVLELGTISLGTVSGVDWSTVSTVL